MPKTAMIRARVDPTLKREADSILGALGLSATEAITMFYKQVQLRNGLPFDVVIPNKLTRSTMADTDAGRHLVRAKDANDLFKKLGI